MRLKDDWGPTGLGYAAIVVAVLAVVAGLYVSVAAVGWHARHVGCLRLHEQTDYPTRMVGSMWGGGCYVFIDGRWIPDTRYRMVDVDQ
jgi:hypothetical protein